MPILQTKKNIYTRNIKQQKRRVAASGFTATKDRIFSIIDKQPDIDDAIFAGICECFDYIESGHIRTGIFVLGRTIEEIATLYIDKAITKQRIGITRKQYEIYKKRFNLYLKLEFLSGEQITLREFGYPDEQATYTKDPKIYAGSKAGLQEIREFGRNVGAHPITASELDNAIRNMDSWLGVGTAFIVDMQVHINGIR